MLLASAVYDSYTFIDCIKGKLTAKNRKDMISRSDDVLELIHIDICEPFTHVALSAL